MRSYWIRLEDIHKVVVLLIFEAYPLSSLGLSQESFVRIAKLRGGSKGSR